MTDQTEIEVVARAIIGADTPENAARCAIAALDAHRSAALPEEVRGLVEWLRGRAEAMGRPQHPHALMAAAADTIEAEHAARMKAEAELAEARRALRDAPHDSDCAIFRRMVSGPPCDCWRRDHAAALAKAADTATTDTAKS
jgi:hypothetical protein